MVAAQPMEWKTLHHLDLRHADPGPKQLQPHAAAFHPNQAIVAVANGNLIIEFDVLTGSKISSLDIGAPVVRMSYSPTSSHTVIAVLEDCTIRSCDFDNEQTCVLHSPEKRSEQVSDDAEVHIALTPLQPVVFFGFHKRMSVTVVGTVEGGRAPTKIKTDLKKPIINLTCHPRFPLLYVAYADGLIRAYNIHTYAVHYTLQLESTIKLVGAGAFAFHPTLEWVFVGDRGGTLLAWDVSTDRPNLIGITQVGSHPIVSVAWHSMLRLLITLSRDGSLQVWRTRVIVDPTKQPMPAKFFEPSGIPQIDITGILFQKEGEGVYPLPRIKSFAVHPKLNLATILFADPSAGDSMKNRASFTREGRKQLFAVLQNARGLTAADLKEKLLSLGSSGILADYQLQTQLQEQHFRGQSQLSMTDIARKAFLHSHFMEGHSKSGPISRLPLITIVDSDYHLRDSPVCQPFHLDLNFFNRENRVLHYPIRAFYMEGTNLMAYNLCSGADNIYKKLYPTLPVNSEYCPKRIIYSSKQHLFLIVVGVTSNSHEVVVYKEQTDLQTVNTKGSVVEGRDAAFIGPSESQYAILENDKTGLALYHLPQPISPTKALTGSNGALDPEAFSEKASVPETGALLFAFDSEVDRIFSSPLESTLMYASDGDHVGLAKLIQGYRVLTSFNQNSAKNENKKALKLRANEIVLQVRWQETLRGYVAGVLTTGRVMIVTADLVILSSSSSSHDTGFPTFRSLLWLGPALLFSTTTTIAVLGWDSIVRAVLSISMPNSVLLGVLNDRILLACPTDINPRQKKGVEIRSCLVGLLEPLLIGFATMQQHFEQKIDLSETLYQLTSRFDSLRISSRSLDILSKGSPVCGDLAVALSQAGPQFTQVQRCIYAVKALRFSTALSVLKDEFLRSRDYPHCHPTSHLFYRFQQLGFACIKHAQFDSAKETFEAISDFQSMLDLFICHLNPSAMRRLAQKLEDAGTDSELRRYCERILRVRSSGWTEGIFANFAAESMMPKGEEWGGGNWEIKTPSNVKATPQWELAAEVMPYMRTSDGAIPAMIADHIGVYLGVMKGRGNVAEVREDSLVKKIVAMNAEPKADGPSTALVKFPSGKSKLPMQGEKEAGSLNSLEAIIRSTAGDEQHKAEVEFKKSLYGHDGNSSEEEEGPSKTKKIHIRIKPAAPATVDVNKIKEATKTFKLGDGLGPPLSRTRSSSGGFQEFALALTQTTPATGAANNAVPVIDLPGGPPVSAPSAEPTPMFMGMGVSAGPIPEDFFQNTISSIQIAASMRPPGTVLVQGMPQPTPASNIPPSSQATTVPIGLPDGGVPPQAQSGQATISLESIGLPDGGVPPQSVSPQPPQPPAGTTTNMSASQPLDLAVLEGISIGVNGTKAAGRPTPPTSVRPGQVPRGADASVCFKTALAHLEQNQLPDALSCLDEAFLALAKDQSQGADVKAQATICAQYKTAVPLLQEIGRLQKVQGQNAISAKDEMARLSRHLASLPLLAKHRINCIRTAIKRNMEVQNYAYSKSMLDLLLSKAPANKQDELRSLIEICLQRGLSNKSIDPLEDPSQFCAVTLSRLSTIGHDACDLCGSKFSALTAPGCIICGMGSIKRSDAQAGPVSTPFG